MVKRNPHFEGLLKFAMEKLIAFAFADGEFRKPITMTLEYDAKPSKYEAYLMLQKSALREDYLCLKTGMVFRGDDRLVSHFILNNTPQAILEYLREESNAEKLLESYDQLYQAILRMD